MRLEMLARAKGLFADTGFLDRFIAIKLDLEDLARFTAATSSRSSAASRWARTSPSLKIWAMEAWQRLTDLLVEAGAEDGVIEGAHDIAGVEIDFLAPFYYARPATIYGGSSEIQRNILAKYVLKLPS